MEIIQTPKGDRKYITVEDLLELADACRQYEIDPQRLITIEGTTGWGNEIRGLKVKNKKG